MASTPPVTLRAERAGDEPAIERLVRSAFASAPRSSGTEHRIVDALRSAGALAVSLVACEARGELVGHAAVSPVMISSGESGWFGLGPVAVLPRRQREGLGSRLVAESLAVLRESGATGCVVLGYPGFYRRLGFRPETALVLPGFAAGHFLAQPFRGRSAAGTVRYHEAFAISG